MPKKLNINKSEHALSILDRFNKMKKDDQGCDFMIKVGSEKFAVHKNILAAGSDYFKAMMSHDTIETEMGMVELKEVDAESAKKCINFIYTGEAEIEEGNEENLLHAAHLLQLSRLSHSIVQFLQDNLDCNSFFLAKRLASIYNCQDLDAKCDEFALNNLDGISAAEGYKNLTKDYVSHLIKIRNPKFPMVFKCGMLLKWVKYDAEIRKKDLANMMKILTLHEIPASYRRFIMEEERLVKENSECTQLIFSSLFKSFNIPSEDLASFASTINALLVFDKTTSSIKSFLPSNQTWSEVNKLKNEVKSKCFSAVMWNDALYVFCSKKVFCLDDLSLKANWNTLPDLLEDHGECPPVIVFDNSIYVVGGYYGRKINLGEKYDGRWAKVKDKQVKCQNSALAVCSGDLYSIGGASLTALYTVEKFDLQTESWSYVASLKRKRSAHAAVTFNNKIYVLGGYSGIWSLRDVEYYSPNENIWTSTSPMLMPRRYFKACVIGGKIFSVGGNTNRPQDVEEYNVEASSGWRKTVELTGMEIESVGSVAVKLDV